MAGRGHIDSVNSENMVASRILRANVANEEDLAVQLHVTPTRARVKDLEVTTKLAAPEVTSLTTRVAALENADVNVPGRLLISDFPFYDASYTLHISRDRIMAAQADVAYVDADTILVSPPAPRTSFDPTRRRPGALPSSSTSLPTAPGSRPWKRTV
jgi:hypothetical protein